MPPVKQITLSHHSTILAVFLIKTKTVFEGWNRYDSVPLDEDDPHLTVFITPWGRCRYNTAPHGYTVLDNGYSLRVGVIVFHITNKTKCVDDSLVKADNHTENFFNKVYWLDICGFRGITLNPAKVTLSQDTVTFAGFEITNPNPADLTDMRSWFRQVSCPFFTTNHIL